MKKVTPLKVAIAKSGYYIREVSERSGVNYSYVSMAVNDRISLKTEHQIAIAKVLRQPVDELFPSKEA